MKRFTEVIPPRTLARLRALLSVLVVISAVACTPLAASSTDPNTSAALPPDRASIARPLADLQAEAARFFAAGQSAAGLATLHAAAEQTADPDLWLDVFHRHVARGEWQAALDALTALLALEPDLPEANYWRGVILAPYDTRQAYTALLKVGGDLDYGDAAQSLRTAIEVHQLDSPASQGLALGEALVTLDHWAQAGQVFSITAALQPDLALAWAYLALCDAAQGQPDDTLVTHALDLAPDNSGVLVLAGMTARLQDEPERAVALLTDAQARDTSNPALAAELGNAYRASGDLGAAESWLIQADSLAPAGSEFLKLLAFFYAEEAYDLDGNGLTVLREATATFPDDADLRAAYGWALFNTGAMAEGVATLRAALDLAPDNPRALYYRGLISQAQGNSDLAVLALSRILRLDDPAGFDVLARRVLERIAF